MIYTKKTKLLDVWKNPMGHDVLQFILRLNGRDENLPKSRFLGNMSIASLDRMGGKGFADVFVNMLNAAGEMTPPTPVDGDAWWKGCVVYHIYLPSFMDSDHDGIGDIGGVIQRLPYLVKLGVEAIWVWPVMDMAFNWKSGAKDHLDVQGAMGNLDDFRALAKAAHANGMKVITGFALSSTSDQHEWFKKALEGDEEYQDYYVFRKGSADTPPNTWGMVGSPPAWNWYPDIQAWALRLLGRHRPDLNWDNPKVRERACEIIEFWQEQGVDGLVFGSANYISKASYANGSPVLANLIGIRGYEHFMYGPHINEYLRDLRAGCVTKPDMMLMGEAKAFGPGLAQMVTGDGTQLDMVLDATHLAIGGRVNDDEGTLSLLELKEYFCKWLERFGTKRWLPLVLETSEHPRMLSRLGASPVYRAILAKLLGTMLLTLRGTPIIFQGEELGLGNTRFASADELKHSVSLRMYAEYKEKYDEPEAFRRVLQGAPDHSRVPMPWSPTPGGGFTGAKPWMRVGDGIDYLNATTQMEDRNSVWAHYRKLIALRNQNTCLRYGSFNPVFFNNKKVFCYFRMHEGEKWYVEMNITEKAINRPGRISPNMHLEVSNYDMPSRMLRPYEANVYRCN